MSGASSSWQDPTSRDPHPTRSQSRAQRRAALQADAAAGRPVSESDPTVTPGANAPDGDSEFDHFLVEEGEGVTPFGSKKWHQEAWKVYTLVSRTGLTPVVKFGLQELERAYQEEWERHQWSFKA